MVRGDAMAARKCSSSGGGTAAIAVVTEAKEGRRKCGVGRL